jgi:hypothetical protein
MNIQDFTITERKGERTKCPDGLRINMTKDYAEFLLINLKAQVLDKAKQEVDICIFGEMA